MSNTRFNKNAKRPMTFNSQADANSFFIEQKQQNLNTFVKFVRENMLFEPDFSPESLKAVEKLYFTLRKERKYKANFITIEDYELYMSVYFGEVVVRNLEGFKWFAEKHFINTNAYSLVIKKSNYAKGISRRRNHYIQKNNKNQEALFREFLQEQKFA